MPTCARQDDRKRRFEDFIHFLWIFYFAFVNSFNVLRISGFNYILMRVVTMTQQKLCCILANHEPQIPKLSFPFKNICGKCIFYIFQKHIFRKGVSQAIFSAETIHHSTCQVSHLT